MAMAAGNVTIDGTGNRSGTGAAVILYDSYITKFTIASGPTGVQAKRQIADLCTMIASLVSYIQGNAEVDVSITTSDSGLQRLPASLVENEPTKAPSGTKHLAGVVT
jgi:hypothetical protein